MKNKRVKEILEKSNAVARIGVWEFDVANQQMYWNKIVREIYEVPKDYTPTLEAVYDFSTPENRKYVQSVFNNAINDGTIFDSELEITTFKGNTRWVRVIGNTDFKTGSRSKVYGTFQDITRVKQPEQYLNQSSWELRAIINSESLIIISTNEDGIINRFNHGAEVALLYSADEVVGIEKPEIYLLKEEMLKFKDDMSEIYGDKSKNFNHYKDLKNQQFRNTREWTYRRKDGSTFSVLTTLSAIQNSKGENKGFVAVSTDISDIKNVENELLKKNQLLNFAEQITSIGHWQWDTVLDIVIWSYNLYEIFELDQMHEEMNFATYFSFVHPDDKKIVSEYFDNTAKDKEFKNFSHRIITTSKKTKSIQLFGSVLTDKEGEVISMIGTCQDVTESQMAERKFKGLLESAPDAMVIVNKKGKIQLINNQAEKLFGYRAEELIDKSVEILVPQRFHHKHFEHRSKFFSKPLARNMGEGKELYGKQKNGKEIPVQISLSPLHSEEGLLISAAIRDITKQKTETAKLVEAKERLEVVAGKLSDQNKQLADFTHITSHNLRAPVANLNSLLEIYNFTEGESEKLQVFNKFEIVIQHLTLTLNTLVDALKTKISDPSENLENIKLEDILHYTQEILSGAILQTNAIIKSDFSQVPIVTYRRVYLESIFLNLIGNAIKYKSETRIPEIHISSALQDGNISIQFSDNGIGIDLKEHGHKLFGLNKVFHRHPEAKGVGLFLTKSQIEAMGGSISAISTVNKGTTFTINF
ncbi:PAS domain-containing sensor histidine kinase [Zobellia amurskyensis]|uniref:PAS domain-containing sensor histidine kinase n=1 Tax=Zobellia amurskyensis TaxID=248905 RepID=UPI0014120738|nr:PAS domain-containing sensor histidine kinase [Zobellia amurskyensis]